MGGSGGHGGRRAAFLFFHVFSAVKNEKRRIVHSFFSSWIRVESVSFWELKKNKKTKKTNNRYLSSVFTDTQSLCVLSVCSLLKLAVSFVTRVVFTPGVVVYLL